MDDTVSIPRELAEDAAKLLRYLQESLDAEYGSQRGPTYPDGLEGGPFYGDDLAEQIEDAIAENNSEQSRER